MEWWQEELTKHWGEGHVSHDTRRAAKVALNEHERMKKSETDFERRQRRIAMMWCMAMLIVTAIGGIGFGLLVLR